MSENISIAYPKSPEENSADKFTEASKMMIANEPVPSRKALLGAIDLEERIKMCREGTAKMIATAQELQARNTLLKARMHIMKAALMEENENLLKMIKK